MRYRYLFYILLLLPVFIFRDYTPANELRYISIAEEALNNNTWFTFYNHGEVYADKPPLFFWFIMLSRLITGEYHMWLIGFFSLLPAIGVMMIMDRWLKEEDVNFNSLVSNLMLLTTTMYIASALVVRMDMLMVFFITLSLYTSYRIYKDRHVKAEKYLLPVYIFLAVFSKGPMGLLTPVVSIIVFLIIKKQLRTIGNYLGWKQWGILAGLCILWFTVIYLEGGWAYLDNLVFKQVFGRSIDSYDHKEPVWFYFPRMLWTFLPWTILFIVLIWRAIRKKSIKSDLEKFFLTIIVTNIVMLSLVSAKLDIYLLPVYPFVVYLCSAMLIRDCKDKAIKVSIGIPIAVLLISLIGAMFFRDKLADIYSYSNINSIVYVCTALLMIGSLITLILLYRGHVLKAVAMISISILGSIFIGGFAIPSLNKYIGLGEMANFAHSISEKDNKVKYAGYKTKSFLDMDIYLDDHVYLLNSTSGLDSLNNLDQRTILFVKNREIRHDEELSHWISRFQCEWSSKDYSLYILGKAKED